MKAMIAALLLIVLSGCATVGKEVTQEQVKGFKKGETTMEEVVSKLGSPTSSGVDASGRTVISYVFVHAQARAATFVPLVGPLIGGADSRSSAVSFTFGPNGVLLDYNHTQSAFGSGTGFAAGRYQQPNADQPREAR